MIAGVGATNDEKFQQMLDWDKSLFASIVQIRLLQQSIQLALAGYDRGKRTAIRNQAEYDSLKAKLNKSYSTWYDLQKAYNARQNDYRTNKAYKLSNSIKEWSHEAATWLRNAWYNGLAVDPIVTPIVITVGVVIAVGVIAYFVSKYHTDAGTQYLKGMETVNELAAINPTLANKMSDQLQSFFTQKQEDQGGGFFNELGKGLGDGLKWGLILLGTGAGAYGIYKVGDNQGWWKSGKTKRK